MQRESTAEISGERKWRDYNEKVETKSGREKIEWESSEFKIETRWSGTGKKSGVTCVESRMKVERNYGEGVVSENIERKLNGVKK